jgi:hypothetical protein
MPRINTYPPDAILQNEDLILGSDYKGEINGVPIYETKSFTLNSLANYLSRFVYVNPNIYDLARYDSLASYAGEYDADGNLLSLSTAFADQILSVTTSDRYANAQFVTNLATSVGVFNPDGTLSSLSEAFANQVLSTTSSERFATSLFATNLASSVGVYDENGVITSLSEAFANQVISTTTSDKFASSEFTTNLASSFGTYDADGNILSYSNATFLDSMKVYVDENSATASKVDAMNSTLQILDENGNAILTNAGYLQSITTHVDANSASAAIARGLNAEFEITDADGNVVKTKAEFDEEITTYVDENSATANIATKLNTEFGIVDPVTGETVKTGAEYLDEVTQHVDDNSSTASKVTNLNSTLDILNADGTVKKNSAQFLQDITTHVDENSATAGLVEALEVTVGNIPLIFRQDDPPSLTETPIGSLWFDTNDNNKGYILVAGDPNVWTIVEDTEFTQFKSTYEEIINNTATESSATATKTTNLNAILEILDENGNLIPQSQSDYFDTITNYVDANSATAEKAETLRVAIEGADGTGGITAELNETSIAVASKPNVYRQNAEPVAPEGETIPLKSVWYDTDDNNKPYIYDGSPASWTEARDGKVTELESYALAQKTIEADANGVVTGITVKSENSGDPDTAISDITFKTNTFNIVDQNDVNRLAFDQNGLTINGSGHFTGDITGASGTFGGTLSGATVVGGVISVPTNDSNRKFYVDSQGSVYISDQAAGTPGLNIRDDSNGSTGVTIASDRIFNAAGVEVYLTPYSSQTASAYLKWGDIATITTGVGSKLLINAADAKFSGNVEIVGDLIVTGSSSSHPNITGAGDVNNIGQTVIQSLDFDTFGHVIGTGSVSIAYPAIINNGGAPELPTGVTAAEVRSLIGAGTSSFSGSYDDLSDKPTLFDGDYNSLSNKPTIYAEPGIYRGGGTPTLATGVTGAEVVSLIGAATAGHLHDTRYLRKDIDVAMDSGHTITATDFILASDQRLKSDINTYTPQHININYRDYVVNNGGDRRRVGVIAQELERNHPEFVMTNPDTGFKSVSYIDMLVAKVAELEERIKQLENGGS